MNLQIAPSPIYKMFMVNQNDFCPGTRPYFNRGASVEAVFLWEWCVARAEPPFPSPSPR